MTEKTLGGVIRQLRKSNGWTLRQMSDKVGIPFSTLAKVEQNKLTLTYERLKQLSSRLEMPIAELFAEAEVRRGCLRGETLRECMAPFCLRGRAPDPNLRELEFQSAILKR